MEEIVLLNEIINVKQENKDLIESHKQLANKLAQAEKEKEQLTAKIKETNLIEVKKLVSDFVFDLISWSDYNLAKKEYAISFEHFKRLCDYYAYEYPLKVGFKNDTK